MCIPDHEKLNKPMGQFEFWYGKLFITIAKNSVGDISKTSKGITKMTKFHYMQDDQAVFMTASPEYHPNATKLPQAKGKELYRLQSIEKVKAMLEGVDTVYGIVRHVSASGMSRDIDLYIIKDNRPVYLTGYASTILSYPMSKSRGMKVGGCGMDMVFHCVSSIAYAIGRDYKTLKSEII